jgi:hypothetical protein
LYLGYFGGHECSKPAEKISLNLWEIKIDCGKPPQNSRDKKNPPILWRAKFWVIK